MRWKTFEALLLYGKSSDENVRKNNRELIRDIYDVEVELSARISFKNKSKVISFKVLLFSLKATYQKRCFEKAWVEFDVLDDTKKTKTSSIKSYLKYTTYLAIIFNHLKNDTTEENILERTLKEHKLSYQYNLEKETSNKTCSYILQKLTILKHILKGIHFWQVRSIKVKKTGMNNVDTMQ